MESNFQLSYSLEDFKRIHHALFKHVYPWAGEIRTVEISKMNRPCAELFAPSAGIEQNFFFCMQELAEDNNLNSLSDQKFIERLAYHFNNLNYIHPFREGNGRTQRIFWSLAARNAGHLIDWRFITSQQMNHASEVGRTELNIDPLIDMFTQAVRRTPQRPSLKDLEVTLRKSSDHLATLSEKQHSYYVHHETR